MRKHAIRYAVGLLILLALLVHASKAYEIPFISSFDNLLYDAKIRLTMPQTVDERLIILDIDEKSLAEIGRWPWGRDRMAALVDKLFDRYGIRALGFDVFFAEADQNSGLGILEKLGNDELRNNQQYLATLSRIRPQLEYDKLFAKALQGRPVILGYYFSSEGRNNGAIPGAVLPRSALEGRDTEIVTWPNFGGNLPEFQKAAFGAGFVNPITDTDGSVRRVPLIAKHEGAYYASLSLAMVRALLENPDVVPGGDDGESSSAKGYGAVDWLDLPTARFTMRIPVDGNMAALVPYRGREKSYRYYSIADLLADRIEPDQIKGRIALVGTTAPGLMDQRTTPVGQIYPGVEVHANLITGMLDGAIKLKPLYAVAVEFLFLLLVGGLMIFLFPWRSPLRATLATLLMLSVIIGINFALWRYANWVQPLASSLLLLGALFVLNMSYGYFVESRTKRQFAELFGQYVPPELVKEMSRNPQSYSMEGRKAELTVLFSDIRGFTAIAEGMEPDQLAKLMNEYLSAMTLVIRKHNGTLDKYIGDAIMAFWGAPVSDNDHARNAVVTALAMQNALDELNCTLTARGMPEMKIGIGINTGGMTVGDMGSVVRKAYTVMGDAVNLGSRLEGITKQYGVGIIVGQSTRDAVSEIVFRELDLVQVKGKEEPIRIFEPLGSEAELSAQSRKELELWHQVLRYYRQQQWQQAEAALDDLDRMQPGCRLYELYRERIAALRMECPGLDWAGVTRFNTK